jgi:hypothetical protein
MPKPLIADVVTPNVGHIPNISTNAGFSFKRPLVNIDNLLISFNDLMIWRFGDLEIWRFWDLVIWRFDDFFPQQIFPQQIIPL